MRPSRVPREKPRTSRVRTPAQSADIRSIMALVGSYARNAPFNAPADTPTIRSGRKPLAMSSASMPTCTAPRLPPPARTNACREGRKGCGTVGAVIALPGLRGSARHYLQALGDANDRPSLDGAREERPRPRRRRPHPERQQRRKHQRDTDAGNAGDPADAIEQLAQNDASDDAAEEVARKIDSACRAAVRGRRAADESGRGGLREKRSCADQREAGEDRVEVGHNQERQ